MGERPQRSILDEIFIKYHFPCHVAAYFNRNAGHAQETDAARNRQERGTESKRILTQQTEKIAGETTDGLPGRLFGKNASKAGIMNGVKNV